MNRSRVDIGIEREGPKLWLSLRQAGRTVILETGPRAASAFAASLTAACAGDEDSDFEFRICAMLTTQENPNP